MAGSTSGRERQARFWWAAVIGIAAIVVLAIAFFSAVAPVTDAEYRMRGMRALQDQRYSAAVADLSQALSLLPTHETHSRCACHVGLGIAYLKLGEFEQAVHQLSRAIELQPEYPGSYLLRANAYDHLGRDREELEDWKERLRLVPDDRFALTRTAACLCDLGDAEAALQYARCLSETSPRNPNAHYTMGYVDFHRGSCDTAVQHFSRAIDLNSGFANAYFARGHCYYRLGQRAKADSDRRSALRLCPSMAAEAYESSSSTVLQRPAAEKRKE